MIDIDAYLRRIRYTGSMAPAIDTLRGLQSSHLMSVPFENLDIQRGRPIRLEIDALFAKIVTNKRGGFCYELNSLFAALLRQLSFDVTLLSARVYNAQGILGPEHDHLCLMVTLDQRWLVDVGFGDSSMVPLLMETVRPQHDGRRAYRVTNAGEIWHVSREGDDGGWKPDYLFTLTPRAITDFFETCLYHQSSPESPFTQRQVCTIATPTGRVTLRGKLDEMKVIVTEDGVKSERLIADPQEVLTLFRDHVGITDI